MVRTDAAIYQKADHPKNASYKNYTYYLNDIYTKYFGHLTGIVMVSRSSVAPLCLGGADFDGDLVNLIFDQDVAEAVKTGVYEREIISEEGRIVNELITDRKNVLHYVTKKSETRGKISYIS